MYIRKERDIFFYLLIIILSLAFSTWLMFHTFSYDAQSHTIRIAFRLWSDFSAHIPLIRSFSMSDNLTNFFRGRVVYPIYSGEPIRYHFLFDMMVGILEKIGIRIDWALNIPSILGFSLLLIAIYSLAISLFDSIPIALLSVAFFLFNGSLSFLRFFQIHPLSPSTPYDIASAREFPAFAPWGPGLVSAFWNLNIYTNQRHLALVFGILLWFIFVVVSAKQQSKSHQFQSAILWGFVFGIFPYFHPPSLIIFAIFLICYFLLYPKRRIFLFTVAAVSLLVAIPQLLSMPGRASSIEWYPGWIIHNELFAERNMFRAITLFLNFWWQNIGIHGLLILLGFFMVPKKARLAIIPVIPLFILANLLKISVEATANHKFFNFILIVGQMLSAYVLVWFWTFFSSRRFHSFIRLFVYSLICLFVSLLTLSGIIDFFVVKNDIIGTLPDWQTNEAALWIAKITPKNAIFLNSTYLYNPASIVGRPIYLGWPYFAWSTGYVGNRFEMLKTIYEAKDSNILCPFVQENHISYITVEDTHGDINLPNIDVSYYFSRFRPSYANTDKTYGIFSTDVLCPPKK